LEAIREVRVEPSNVIPTKKLSSTQPNHNPFVDYMLTLYSQSQTSNSGTRGLDTLWGEQTYVETALDREMLPAVLNGEFALVIITGNAGDGKTAFLQMLYKNAQTRNAKHEETLPNGYRFQLSGRTFWCNYDGSQDEEDRSNDTVLEEFFAPFEGLDSSKWVTGNTRLIAINEGRLVDFLQSHSQFEHLRSLVALGLRTGESTDGIAVINLNLRSVIADTTGERSSIFDQVLQQLTQPRLWTACHSCDLKQKCYVFHNAQTFQDPITGTHIADRLKLLYTLTHWRGRLHITLRDLRSALAFMLVGTRNCKEIHDLYEQGSIEKIAQGFYFNSWMGGDAPNQDRLLQLLREVDMGNGTQPKLDRRLDYQLPSQTQRALLNFETRSDYDQQVIQTFFTRLERGWTTDAVKQRRSHRSYIDMTRRRFYFESRDAHWRGMLSYRSTWYFHELLQTDKSGLAPLLEAISRGEGLAKPQRLQGDLALQLRDVEKGTIRSYRIFPKTKFTLEKLDESKRARFVEHQASGLLLRYQDGKSKAELRLNLDVFEMLHRLNEGYRPTVEQQQGYYLSLSMFKNILAAVPYQEILLTITGHDFYRVSRKQQGRLLMEKLGEH
jgi:hypothetical protein